MVWLVWLVWLVCYVKVWLVWLVKGMALTHVVPVCMQQFSFTPNGILKEALHVCVGSKHMLLLVFQHNNQPSYTPQQSTYCTPQTSVNNTDTIEMPKACPLLPTALNTAMHTNLKHLMDASMVDFIIVDSNAKPRMEEVYMCECTCGRACVRV